MPPVLASRRRARNAGVVALAGLIVLVVVNALTGLGGTAVSKTALPVAAEAIIAAAVVTIVRAARRGGRERAGWLVIAAGATSWTAGDVFRMIAFPGGAHRYFPSPADAGYLLLYPCLYVGLGLLLRARVASFRRSLWLDGLIGAAGMSAIGVSLAVRFVMTHVGGDTATVATNVAYPLLDTLLLAQLVAGMAMTGWRLGREWLLLLCGLAIFATGDATYAYTSASGTTYSTLIGALWVIGFVVVAVAARTSAPAAERLHLDGRAVMAVPAGFALLSIGLLAYGRSHPISSVGADLAIVTLLLGMARTALSFRENTALLESHRASLTDELTGLPNRRRLNRHLATLGASPRPDFAGLLLIDLDGFKELNDTLGHHAGDILLAELGPRLAAVGGLQLVARLGGDEFAVVVAGAPAAETLNRAADRLHRTLQRPFMLEDLTIHVGASIGGALAGTHGDAAAELLRHADVAMYHAKATRTGYELYRPERDLNSRDRLRFVAQLRHGLSTGELVVHYQPKAITHTGEITGVEALVRWQHPEEGLLSPDRFLPVAESAGLMRQLTTHVLGTALRQIAAWDRDGLHLGVAVNLAMPNLVDTRLPDEVARLLDETGVDASRLTLEITENIVMADPDRILDVVGRLSRLGVGLSLDDFGAGASSLGYIRRLTVDELKIDRSFVMTMEDDEDNAAIVRATIELAHSLDLRVVAEGVETQAGHDRLKRLGCDEIQGFLLSRPVAPVEIPGRVRSTASASPAPAPA